MQTVQNMSQYVLSFYQPTNSGDETGFNIRILAQRRIDTLTKRSRSLTHSLLWPVNDHYNQSAKNGFIQICL